MKYGRLFCALVAIFYGNTTFAQQPGGVSGTKAWFKTIYNQSTGKASWIDFSGNTYELLGDFDFGDLNFHKALEFNGIMKSINMSNVKLDQATFIGSFYPNYRKDFEGSSFFSLKYNTHEVLSFKHETITSKGDFSYNPNFKKHKSETAMKPAFYYLYRQPANQSIWGEESESQLNIQFKGMIPEFIIYDRVITPNERWKLESYLSISYGTTLDSSYISSKGAVLWDRKANQKFHNRVCAIGKDSLGAIRQPKSNSSYEEKNPAYLVNSNGTDDIDYWSSIDGDNSKIRRFIPANDSTSIFRSLTIGFQDRSLRAIKDHQFIFWGDNNGKIDSLSQPDPAYKGLVVSGRRWYISNRDKINQPTKIEVSGNLHKSMYDPYDYQKFGYVLVKLDKALKNIETTYLFTYLGRQVYVNEFLNNKIVWDKISWGDKEDHYFTFGIVPKLKLEEINGSPVFQKYFENDQPVFSAPIPGNDVLVTVYKKDNYGVKLKFSGGISPFKYTFQKVGSNVMAREIAALDAEVLEENLTHNDTYIITMIDKVGQTALKRIKINRKKS